MCSCFKCWGIPQNAFAVGPGGEVPWEGTTGGGSPAQALGPSPVRPTDKHRGQDRSWGRSTSPPHLRPALTAQPPGHTGSLGSFSPPPAAAPGTWNLLLSHSVSPHDHLARSPEVKFNASKTAEVGTALVHRSVRDHLALERDAQPDTIRDGGVLSPHPRDPLLPRRWQAACRKVRTLENVSVSDGERGS